MKKVITKKTQIKKPVKKVATPVAKTKESKSKKSLMAQKMEALRTIATINKKLGITKKKVVSKEVK